MKTLLPLYLLFLPRSGGPGLRNTVYSPVKGNDLTDSGDCMDRRPLSETYYIIIQSVTGGFRNGKRHDESGDFEESDSVTI